MVVLMLRVIIADDHPIVRIGQKVVIEANGRCKVVAEADGPDQLLALVDSTPCDILVTDFAMPGNQQAVPQLSGKEREVVRMLASGMTVSQIAARVNRSISTISKQKSTAMTRLCISTDVDLFAYARSSGMVP